MKNMHKIAFVLAMVWSVSFAACQQKPGTGGKVSADEFEKLLKDQTNPQLLDVRTADEFAGGHLKGAVNVPVNDPSFEQVASKLNKKKPVYVYCLSGGRSSSAASYLRNNGFTTVYEMPGVMAWRNAGKELVTGNEAPAVKQGGYTEAEFLEKVKSDKYVLVDFNAVWCRPCKELTPIMEKVSAERQDKMILIKLDADIHANLLQAKGIGSIPYLELYKDGKLIWKHTGLIDEATFLKETGL